MVMITSRCFTISFSNTGANCTVDEMKKLCLLEIFNAHFQFIFRGISTVSFSIIPEIGNTLN